MLGTRILAAPGLFCYVNNYYPPESAKTFLA